MDPFNYTPDPYYDPVGHMTGRKWDKEDSTDPRNCVMVDTPCCNYKNVYFYPNSKCPECGAPTPDSHGLSLLFYQCHGRYPNGGIGLDPKRGLDGPLGQDLMVRTIYHFGSSSETHVFWKAWYLVGIDGKVKKTMNLWEVFNWWRRDLPRVKVNMDSWDEKRVLERGFTKQEMDFFWASQT
jgi:hypothetical protein